jgi:hypothetical protein
LRARSGPEPQSPSFAIAADARFEAINEQVCEIRQRSRKELMPGKF